MPLDRIDAEILFDIDYNSLEQALVGTGWLSGWVVTGNAGTLSVDVAAGKGMAAGAYKSTAGSTNVVLTAADATNPRKDLIVWDTSAGALANVDGTPGVINPAGETNPRKMKVPAPPDLGASDDILIAEVYVPAGETHGSDCTIIDKRVMLPLIYLPSQAQGDIWYFDGNKLTRLAPGTAGDCLVTGGAAANPSYATRARANVGNYTGNDSADRAVAHGLGKVPLFVEINDDQIYMAQGWLYNGWNYIKYFYNNGGGSLSVAAMDTTNFYVGNATSYTNSCNKVGFVYRWVAIG